MNKQIKSTLILLLLSTIHIYAQNIDTLLNDSTVQEYCRLDALVKTSVFNAIRSGKLTSKEMKLVQSDCIDTEEIKTLLTNAGIDVPLLEKKGDINKKIREKYPELDLYVFLEATKQIRANNLKEKNKEH